jgi:hypothetical protein
MVVGDRRKYLSVCVTLHLAPNPKNPDEGFTDDLSGPSKNAGIHGSSAIKTVHDARSSAEWAEYLRNGIEAYNQVARWR